VPLSPPFPMLIVIDFFRTNADQPYTDADKKKADSAQKLSCLHAFF
jgi:hypothetical protein